MKNDTLPDETKKRKQDALELAYVIYDIFKEMKRKEHDKIANGQNNAQPRQEK